MIEALATLGQYSIAQREGTDESHLQTLVDDPKTSTRYKHVLFVTFDAAIDYSFTGVEYEEYSKEKICEYLYKKGAPNGPDVTPTARVAAKIEKTFDNKIVKWFENALDDDLVRQDQTNYAFLLRLYDAIERDHDRILVELTTKFDAIDKKDRVIISILIENDPIGRYVGDFPIFRQIVSEKGVEAYYKRYGFESVAYDQACSVCKTVTPEVYGFASTFAFYNVDKPGFVSSGFDQSKAWKNYPVCERCALILEEGRKFLERDFAFRMYNLNYFIIPKPLFDRDSGEVIKKFLYYKRDFRSLSPKNKRMVDAREDDILNYLSEQHNFFNNNFLFYEKSNAAFRILLYIEDVLPSHIRRMFEAKAVVDEKSVFKAAGKDGESLLFDFRAVNHFFWGSDKRKHFLEVIDSIFTSRHVDYSFLIRSIINKIRDDYARGTYTKYSTLRGIQLLLFLHEMDLLKRYEGDGPMKETTIFDVDDSNPVVDAVNTLFDEFPDFFGTDAKRAVFLEGVLTEKLLRVQYVERGGATPFKSKLNSLNLDERLLKKLLPQIQNKFQEYGKDYYRTLEKLLAEHMVKAGTNWKMTPDEISFYFVMGMNLSDYVKGSPAASVEGDTDG